MCITKVCKTWLYHFHNWHIFVSKRLRASSKSIHDTQNEYLPKILPKKPFRFWSTHLQNLQLWPTKSIQKNWLRPHYIYSNYFISPWLWLKFFSRIYLKIYFIGQPSQILILRSVLVNALWEHPKQIEYQYILRKNTGISFSREKTMKSLWNYILEN